MNNALIERYNNIAKYYNKEHANKLRFKGFYDILILTEYLSSFENCLFIETDKNIKYYWYIDKNNMFNIDSTTSKIYIQKKGIKLKVTKIELFDFVNKYDDNFWNKYEEILRNIKYPSLRRLVMIRIDNCSFCDNPSKDVTFIIENIYTRYGYQYCDFCEKFAKYGFIKFKIKTILKKFKIYSKIVGKIMKLYYNTKQ
jgi:hypothetical protein